MSITRDDIEAAANRIFGKVRITPVVDINGREFGLDFPLNLKLELTQHAGSFKARGAMNSLLSFEVPDAGVAAASGGNHGAAIAWAAQQIGVPANIFVPEISAPAKINRIKSYGAELHICGALYADTLAACQKFQEQSNALQVHAFDQNSTLAGQGTVAREWQQQVPDLDTVLVAVGGGGLIGGMAAWYQDKVKIVAVEPETSCALHAARKAGQPVNVDVSGVAADSLGARSVGQLMFPLAKKYIDECVLVTDNNIVATQKMLWQNLQIISEPGGAAALAALVSGGYVPERDERVGVLLCGANTDPVIVAAL